MTSKISDMWCREYEGRKVGREMKFLREWILPIVIIIFLAVAWFAVGYGYAVKHIPMHKKIIYEYHYPNSGDEWWWRC